MKFQYHNMFLHKSQTCSEWITNVRCWLQLSTVLELGQFKKDNKKKTILKFEHWMVKAHLPVLSYLETKIENPSGSSGNHQQDLRIQTHHIY